MALVIQRSLEKYYALVGVDVEEIRAVLGVILNNVTNLLIDACAKMNMDMMRMSAFSKFHPYVKLGEMIRFSMLTREHNQMSPFDFNKLRIC